MRLRNKTRTSRSFKAVAQDALARSRKDALAVLTYERSGRQTAQFSARSFMAIDIRRNMSNISTQEFQHVVLAKVSRWTVARAEVIAAAALHGAHRARMLSAGDGPNALAQAVAEDERRIVNWSGCEVIARVQLDDVWNFRFTCTTS